jgi:hypothetical protein
MRPLLYLLSASLVLPVAALAVFFEAVVRVADAPTRSLWGTLWDAAGRLIRVLDVLGRPGVFPVLLLGAAAMVLGFVALAWSARYRRVGCALTAAVGSVALAVVVLRAGPPRTLGEGLFLAPALLGVGLAAWQLATDVRGMRGHALAELLR